MSSIAAIFSAIVGIVVGVFLSGTLFRDRDGESALALGPLGALVFGAAVFILVFRKLSRYGEDPDDDSQ
jgi:uncharacterized membrane protein YeaQ/YmgE (transglycosylase-associated protein family)